MNTALKFKARKAGNMRIVEQTIILHTQDVLARRRKEQLELFRLIAPVPLKAASCGTDEKVAHHNGFYLVDLFFEDNGRETITAEQATRREREQTQRLRLCV
ncbi:MAG: hypothetical protein KBB55_02405 [Candidatus Buchananbacteria bacterium]|nr:hypothetical protein [Candidatus Buchananbacteria bacterium]